MGGAPYIRLKQGDGLTFAILTLCITKHVKLCIRCVTSWAEHLLLHCVAV